jgi:NitT/TauT family transport system permease protein
MIKKLVTGFLPAALFLATWEVLSRRDNTVAFFFSSPSQIIRALVQNTYNGMLLNDFFYTALPTLSGFVVSVLLGTILGLLLAFDQRRPVTVRIYINTLATVPIFAIAPMMIIWFGIGLKMKFALAVFATIFVAISQAYSGALTITIRQRQFFDSLGANRWQMVRYLFLPLSIEWVFGGMKVTSSLALLGTFLGEFMASDHGLAHRMLVAGSLYDVSLVLACSLWMIALVALLNGLAMLANQYRRRIIEFTSIARLIWSNREGETTWQQ